MGLGGHASRFLPWAKTKGLQLICKIIQTWWSWIDLNCLNLSLRSCVFVCFGYCSILIDSDWFLKADARSAVLEDILFYIENFHPRSFVLENVKHVLTSSKHRLNVLKPALRRRMKHDMFHWCLLMFLYFSHNHNITKMYKDSQNIQNYTYTYLTNPNFWYFDHTWYSCIFIRFYQVAKCTRCFWRTSVSHIRQSFECSRLWFAPVPTTILHCWPPES